MKYWIPKGRAEVKRVLRKFNVCQKYQGSFFKIPPILPWSSNKVIRSLPTEDQKKRQREEKYGCAYYLRCCEGNSPENCC